MHTRGVVYKSLLLALIAGAWPADPGHAQAAVDVTVRSRLMTAAVSPSGGISGLFLTDPGKPWLLYRDSKSEEPRRIAFGEFRRSYEYGAPAGLVFADPRLYVYDASTRKVWSHLVHSEAKAEDEFITRLSKHPSHIAVSPHGLVAVIQDQEVFFLQKEKEPIRYPRSRFPQPIDLAFSSWNTLHVLDAVRNTLVSITFRRQADGQIVFEHEASLPVPEDGVQRKWRGMSIYEGVAYLVDETAVYAYLESDKRLVPVAMRADDRNPIQGLALTYDRLYALHADHIASYRRAQPVDLALEGGPVESQRALLALYRYLQRAGLLLTRTVRARSEQTRVNDFLFANGVLLVPSARTTRASTPQPPSTEETNFMELFCSMNAQVCREGEREQPRSLKMIVRKGSEVRIPLVQVLSRLGREHVELDGLPLAEHLAWRVPTTDLRKQAETLLLKLNPGWTQEDVLQRKNGAAILPVEHWTVIVAVPASDFRNRSSALWSLAHGYAGASLYGREGFTAQSGSLPLAQPPPAAISTDCQTLKQASRTLSKAIGYPLQYRKKPTAPGDPPTAAVAEEEAPTLLYPPLHVDAPRIGILEYAATVRTGHQAFCRDAAAPSWHQAVNLELIAEPKPATYSAVSRDLTGASTFSEEAHHGTHVAGIIGGRQMDCWSGLLPKARLLLVDLTDQGKVRRSIADAVNVDVRVFNVSQAFDGNYQTLEDTLKYFHERALFVAAAGPGKGGTGRILNDTDDVPAPARWGQWRNVITVTGTDAAGTLLTQLNRGKRYVDLAAVGQNVYSASEAPGTYGAATGSSQAAPQVAAAAAILVDPAGEARLSPGDAKARLIATADWDWNGGYDQALWGGRLDFAAAVRFPQRHVLVTATGAALDHLHSISLRNDPTIRLTNAPTYFERQGTTEIAPDSVKFERILSLRKQPDGRFRVVLRQPNTDHLKIILNAELASDEKIECHSADRFFPDKLAFQVDTEVCSAGISIDQVEQYFRGGSYHIQWP